MPRRSSPRSAALHLEIFERYVSSKAFYGLAHAPRKRFERCVEVMLQSGWSQVRGDKCLFALDETGGKILAGY